MSDAFKNMKVLVVDDQSVIVRILTKLLSQIGFTRIEQASDGVEALTALRKAEADPFDLIISDWNMPNKTGLELLVEVRADPVYGKVPFVMITAEAKPENVMLAIEQGISSYIAKPFTADTLREKVNIALGINA